METTTPAWTTEKTQPAFIKAMLIAIGVLYASGWALCLSQEASWAVENRATYGYQLGWAFCLAAAALFTLLRRNTARHRDSDRTEASNAFTEFTDARDSATSSLDSSAAAANPSARRGSNLRTWLPCLIAVCVFIPIRAYAQESTLTQITDKIVAIMTGKLARGIGLICVFHSTRALNPVHPGSRSVATGLCPIGASATEVVS